MDFELKHLDMIQADITDSNQEPLMTRSTIVQQNTRDKNRVHNNSLVLDDLTQQIEDLQNRLKINYKKTIIYETENQKLIQQKNTLFFENKELKEKTDLVLDKNKKLISYNNELEIEVEKLNHLNETSAKLIEAQKTDLTRLSKFHLKIKNIIKPYVENLKNKNSELELQLKQKNKLIEQSEMYKTELEKNVSSLKNEIETIQKNYAHEKNLLIQGYEEQFHFLSKEIVNEQQKTLDLQSENLKLKKQCETKHYIENELIKIKRTHDEQLQIIHNLKLKESDLSQQITVLKLNESDSKNELCRLNSKIENLEQVLESTRHQLNSKLNELETAHLRLKMLEKLNTNLSLSLKDYQV